ncbi:MAG: ATP synthase F1 subunit gamma [Bacteroidetes bacterium]|nr:ATP synthase F1 subunit gamma [Bacteroidota bacterium]
MATLREIRRRISGIKSTEKITKAMKMVAAAKLRRTQEAIFATRPYARKLQEVLSHLIDEKTIETNPFFQERPLHKVALVVMAGERGLCGAFNSNILRAATDRIKSYEGVAEVSIIPIGKKSVDFFVKRNYSIAASYPGIFDALQFHHAKVIGDFFVQQYIAGAFDKIEVIYNEFKSVLQQRVVIEQFLPFSIPQRENIEQKKVPEEANYIFEPSQEEILSLLVPRHLNYHLWRMLLESATAEQGARMTAMNNATENASELLSLLTLNYNKTRQAGITTELLEIVSGAEALQNAG